MMLATSVRCSSLAASWLSSATCKSMGGRLRRYGADTGTRMLSLVKEYWQAMLAQAFCVGIGAGCLFVPSVAVLSTYFNTRISTVMGIAASGSSLGGVIYPIMFYKLIPQVGFGWTVRIIGFTILATLAVPCTVMRMRVKPAAKRKLVDTSAFKEMPYTIFCLACFLGRCSFPVLPAEYILNIPGRFHGPLYPLLLCLLLWSSWPHRRRKPEFLFPPDAQRRQCLWTNPSQHCGRQSRHAEHDVSFGPHIWIAYLLYDCRTCER